MVDNFLLKSDESSIVYDKIAEWAAALVQSNVAHVIFLTDETSYSKALSKSLPDRVFRQVALGDLSPDVAKNYVISHLEGLHQDDIARQKEEGIDDGDHLLIRTTDVVTSQVMCSQRASTMCSDRSGCSVQSSGPCIITRHSRCMQ